MSLNVNPESSAQLAHINKLRVILFYIPSAINPQL